MHVRIRACSFTAGLKCIVLMYIFTFHIVKITQRVLFFSSQISMITNVILVFIQQLNKQYVNIKRRGVKTLYCLHFANHFFPNSTVRSQ